VSAVFLGKCSKKRRLLRNEDHLLKQTLFAEVV
jgi:hypothetical protein